MRSAAPRPVATSSAASRSRRRGFTGGLRLLVEVERNGRWRVGAGFGREIGLLVKSHHAGEKRGGQAFDRDIVVASELVEAAAFDADPVLRAFELGLEFLEVGGR